MTPLTRRWIGGVSLLGLAAFGGCSTAEQSEELGIIAIEGGTVFTSPGVVPVEDGVVLVINGVIEAVGPRGTVSIPSAAVRIDAVGLSVLPGFWNARVQADQELLSAAASGSDEELQLLLQDRFTRFGFSSVVEAVTPRDSLALLIERIESGAVAGPRILAIGGTTIEGVHWATPAELLDPESGLATFAQSDIAVIFSLAATQREATARASGDPVAEEDPLGLALTRLRGFLYAGGRIVFGTGAGFAGQYDPLTDHLLLEEAGIPFPFRLAALTTEAAGRFGYLYLGAIEPGMVADLVLLAGDPELDATAFTQVRVVLREGRPLFVR
jgi:imidazolonepropionase-like amidohydrolase